MRFVLLLEHNQTQGYQRRFDFILKS